MTPAPDPTTEVLEWDLSLDELRAVREHLPGLVLPAFVPAGAPADDVVDDLVERGILTAVPATGATSWSDDLDGPFLLSLALQNAGSIVIQVAAWTPTAVTGHSSVIQAGAASHLTVQTGTDHGAGTARVRGTILDRAWQTLAALVPVLEVSGRVRGTTTVSTVASQAIVDAITGGDPRVLDAVARELRVPTEAVALFRGLAEPVRHGFRVKAFTLDGGPVFAGNWFGTSRGWLRMSVGLDPVARTGEFTPELITDAGTVTVTAQTDEDIRTELLSLVAGLIRDRDA